MTTKQKLPAVLDYNVHGIQNHIEVLRNEDNLNVFLISHDFTHPLVDKIQIVKEKNISTVRA